LVPSVLFVVLGLMYLIGSVEKSTNLTTMK
jgi:hypothetical protein